MSVRDWDTTGTYGPAYDPEIDARRIATQLGRILKLMSRQRGWLTLGEISAKTGDPEASISAQLRHLRKPSFGEWIVLKRHRGDERDGLWEYAILSPTELDEYLTARSAS